MPGRPTIQGVHSGYDPTLTAALRCVPSGRAVRNPRLPGAVSYGDTRVGTVPAREQSREALMAMVGLFWIGEDSVYVGAEPVGGASGVRLTEAGVETLGAGQGTFWAWDEVVRIGTDGVPVRSGARRMASMAFDAVLAAVTGGGGELPPAFLVELVAAEETVEVTAHVAVAGGIYQPSEYELSVALLERLAEGRAEVGDLLRWGRDHAAEGTPPREEREALLRKWAGV
ncbi:hypothetical protein [Streptomyces sp. NPDC006140]|uniref:hypothetical protein n=1 Tax=Streptomyces sp. NPDC006140 TaxID=3154579 RepID=UPI0033DB48E9